MKAQTIVNRLAKRALDKTRAQEAGSCRYRDPRGAKCFVGCLITDKQYTHLMERKSVLHLKDDGLLPEPLVPHVELLTQAQLIHDSEPPAEWDHQLRILAAKHGCTYPR